MTSINAGGAFYRVQNSLNQNSESVSKSMQRLASGQQNIAPGDRTASSAVAWGMKAEAASLKIGMQNGTEALQAVEMLNNDIQAMNDIVVRLEELYALSTNSFNTTEDNVAIENEATKLLSEISRIATDAKWKGNAMVSSSTINTIGFGRNGGTLSVYVADLAIPDSVAVGGTNTLTGKDIAGTNTSANDNPIASEMVSALSSLKQNVDTMSINAGALYNEVTNVLSHLGSLNAGYALDVSSKMDVDFAGETTELAKGQILAQAGTAMLAQANAQGQGMLALIQS
ncbi:flagellin [Planktomarina temperata]|jgi:flagellin|nr:flagellin [Planktomarina temperata]